MKSICQHLRRQLFRVIIGDGRTQVEERCLDCNENARGSGIWVPQDELIGPLTSLPLHRDLRSPEARGDQPLLF